MRKSFRGGNYSYATGLCSKRRRRIDDDCLPIDNKNTQENTSGCSFEPGGEAVLLHVDIRSVPVQVRALHAERLGDMLRPDADRHEHRKVPRSLLFVDAELLTSDTHKPGLRHIKRFADR